MKISLNWILEYIPGLEISSFKELEKGMISAGLDIESIENEAEKYNNILVGKVLEVTKHPNAEKLTLCKVDIGEKVLDVICGAANVKENQKVPVAIAGAIIPNGNFEIKKSKIRGELSEGMICAEDELNISDDHTGIMVLDESAEVGTKFSDYFKANDYLIEIGVTPNRGDLFSQIGMAREIAAIFSKKIEKSKISLVESENKTEDFISIEIESKEFCKRFTGRVVKNVKIKESPDWLKKRLTSVGLRPINNVVDITNFIMIETGQPLHAFDYDKIRQKKIVVKTAKEGDKFVTLDSKERILNDKSLMVCDGEGYSAIAGIMGGESSEITDRTKNVFIESAYFDPVCVRKNSRKLGLQTDASQRFERGVDIDNVVYASNRAAQLMQELADGEVSKGLIDVYPEKFDKLLVGIRSEKASKLIGFKFIDDEIIDLLEKIEIKLVNKEGDKLIFDIPEFRRYDISREVDLIEEVSRIHGYENISSDYNFNVDVSSQNKYSVDFQNFENKVRSHFIGRGFNEIISYSQEDSEVLKNFTENYVRIENPNSVEMNTMRANLTYGMLTAVRNNLNNLGKDVSLRLFEIGNVFLDEKNSFSENTNLCFSLCGKSDLNNFSGKEEEFGILDLKGELEILFSILNIEYKSYIYYNEKSSFLELKKGDCFLGKIEKVNEESLRLFDIKSDVFLCELNLNVLYKEIKVNKVYKTISRFPSVKRDLALIVDKEIPYIKVHNTIINSGGRNLKNLDLFDIYSDEKLGINKKSMAFSLEFQSGEKTLTDDEINKQIEKIIKNLKKELNIDLRS